MLQRLSDGVTNNIPGLHGKSGLSHLYKNIIE